MIVNSAVFAEPLPAEAAMVVVTWLSTWEVVTVKVAVPAPAAIVTDTGTEALELLDVRPIVAPPAGAVVEMVTVPVAEPPP